MEKLPRRPDPPYYEVFKTMIKINNYTFFFPTGKHMLGYGKYPAMDGNEFVLS